MFTTSQVAVMPRPTEGHRLSVWDGRRRVLDYRFVALSDAVEVLEILRERMPGVRLVLEPAVEQAPAAAGGAGQEAREASLSDQS